jgi:hypothetical protein
MCVCVCVRARARVCACARVCVCDAFSTPQTSANVNGKRRCRRVRLELLPMGRACRLACSLASPRSSAVRL